MKHGQSVRRMRWAAIVCAGLVVTGCGLTAPRGDEGFATLVSPGVADTERVLSLSIGPAVLRLAARLSSDDPEAQAVLRGLEGVRVRIYEITGDAGRVGERLRRASDDLQGAGWAPVAVVREPGHEVHMLARASDERIEGVVVMVTDSDEREVVLVNVMGQLEPALFSDAMAALDVPAPQVLIASN